MPTTALLHTYHQVFCRNQANFTAVYE